MKQGAEAFKNIFRGMPLNRRSGVECRIRDDQGVNRNGFTVDNNQRIHVNALDVGSFDGQAAKPNQEISQGIEINRPFTTKRLSDEMFEPQTLNHGTRLGVRERRQSKDNIAERFGQNAAKSQEDARAKLRVADHTGNQLSPPGNHFGDQQTDFAIVIPTSRPQLVRSPLNRLDCIKTEANKIPFGLVSNARPAQFHHNRQANIRCRTSSFGGVLDEDFLRNDAPISDKHPL